MEASNFISDKVAAFAVGQTSFPPEVVNEAKRMVLDQLGCSLASALFPWSISYLEAIRSLGGGSAATVIYFGDKLRLDEAIFINSTFAHGCELDDTQLRSSNHAGACVVPTAMVLAEANKLPGRTMLESIIVGLEVAIRVGDATVPHMFNRGHHIPPATGPFGSAAASARAMGLDQQTALHAIAISGSYCGGHLEYTQTGGSVKRSHCAIPAAGGFRAAVMASHGISGPLGIFEGTRGYLKTFAGEYDETVITQDLGSRYHLLETAYKPVASPYSAHGCIEAFDTVVRENGIRPEDVASINFDTSPWVIRNVASIKNPSSILEAHFSLAHSCAVRLYRGGNGVYDYVEEDLNDPRFQAIRDIVTTTPDPVADEERIRLQTRPARATIVTRDGRSFSHRVLYSKGNPKNPMTDDELTAKFMNAAVPRIGTEKAERLADLVWKSDTLEDASELLRLSVK